MWDLNLVNVFILVICMRPTFTWDIAVSHDGGIELESSTGELLATTALQMKPGALYYDPTEQRLFFGDTSGDSSIRSLDLSGPTGTQSNIPGAALSSQSVVLSRPGDATVQGIAYDPLERALYWTDGATGRRILRYELPAVDAPDQLYEAGKRRVLFTFDEEMPQGIAVDACRRKLYWTNANHKQPSIERSNLDGTERETLISSDLFIPLGIAIDQASKRIYWADDKEGIYFRIESAALDGSDRRVEYDGKDHQPSGLAISPAGQIYWTDWVYKALWSLDISPSEKQASSKKPLIMQKFHAEPVGIVWRMNTTQAYGNADECTNIMEVLQNRTEPSPRIEVQCLHGIPSGAGCVCASGYTGLHCELPLCHNYCLGGARCYVANNEPMCNCPTEREGPRCEITKTRSALIMMTAPEPAQGSWMQRNESDEVDELQLASQQPTVSECLAKSSVPVLISLCCLLLLTTCVLTWRLYHSTRRPRIHKRIIVNKNQPMSSRPSPDGSNCLSNNQPPITAPETCEITIENCCNMNICETPCFDPVTYREPTEKHRSKKEEKKNLLVGMETGDDLY